MTFITLFSAARFFRRFSHYAYFAQYPGPELERTLEHLFDAELRIPARRARIEALATGLGSLLSSAEGVERPADMWQFTCQCERYWYLDMLLIGLKIKDSDYMSQVLTWVDAEPARAAVARYGSAVFVVPHTGPHLLTPFVLAKYGFLTALTGGYEAEDIAGGLEIAALNGLPINQSHALPIGPDFRVRCLEQLARGVGIMVYPEYSKAERIGSLRTSFLGARVHMPTGAARLALAAQRPLISVRWVPTGPHRYELRVGPIVEPEALGRPGGVDACMRAVFDETQALVRAQPAAWEGWHYLHQMTANGAALPGGAA